MTTQINGRSKGNTGSSWLLGAEAGISPVANRRAVTSSRGPGEEQISLWDLRIYGAEHAKPREIRQFAGSSGSFLFFFPLDTTLDFPIYLK